MDYIPYIQSAKEIISPVVLMTFKFKLMSSGAIKFQQPAKWNLWGLWVT